MPTKHWKLGIVGWPLGYSLSPLMHEAALKAAGLNGEYKEYAIAPEQLEGWLQSEAPKLDGFNVTMPHKEAVFGWVSQRGELGRPFPELLRAIGALNTIQVNGGRFVGFNTDGIGFLAPLSLDPLRGRSVLLLGAGGSAQAIAVYLVHGAEIGSLKIWNRHPERAEALAEKVNALHRPCRADSLSTIDDALLEEVALLVNATPMGMSALDEPPFDLKRLGADTMVYDIVYEPRETALIRAAKSRDCRVITGDEMLAAQAAASFEIWTGLKGMLPVMKKTLHEHFARAAS